MNNQQTTTTYTREQFEAYHIIQQYNIVQRTFNGALRLALGINAKEVAAVRAAHNQGNTAWKQQDNLQTWIAGHEPVEAGVK